MTEIAINHPVLTAPASPMSMAELWRRMVRFSLITLGWAMIVLGAVFAVLPGHIGLPVVLVGLAFVLRNSSGARRQFILFQRRHPNWVFPIRRLMRRRPEVGPVLWQQLLRSERALLPAHWRRARRVRRALRRRIRA